MLCRVRHKGYSSKNSGENYQEQHFGPHLQANLPDCEQFPGNADLESNIFTDYQYRDYRILASILVGEPVLPIENKSSVNFKGNTLKSVYSYFDTLSTKSNEDNQYENLISFDRELHIENKTDDCNSQVLTSSDMYCYNRNRSQDVFNESQPDPTINFEELNRLASTGKYSQETGLTFIGQTNNFPTFPRS